MKKIILALLIALNVFAQAIPVLPLVIVPVLLNQFAKSKDETGTAFTPVAGHTEKSGGDQTHEGGRSSFSGSGLSRDSISAGILRQ